MIPCNLEESRSQVVPAVHAALTLLQGQASCAKDQARSGVGEVFHIFFQNARRFLDELRTFKLSKDLITLPETNSSPLKIDGWKTILSFWGGLFSGVNSLLVSGRVVHGLTVYWIHHIPPFPPINLKVRFSKPWQKLGTYE